MSFDGILPGESYLYRFTLRQAGTYWYHSHSLFQEQAGLYGAIVVDPREPPPYHWDREHVVLLSDWTDLDPAALFRRLKKAPHHVLRSHPTVGDPLRGARRHGLPAPRADRAARGRRRSASVARSPCSRASRRKSPTVGLYQLSWCGA